MITPRSLSLDTFLNSVPETWYRVILLYVFLFTFLFAANHFQRVGAVSVSHFLPAAIKFSCFSYDEIGLLCFFISRFSSFSVIHVNVDIKMKSKERIGFVVVVYSLKVRVLEIQNFNPAYMKGWTYVRSIQPKFRPVRPGKVDHLKGWTSFFETFPVGPNRYIEFWTEIS